MNGDSKSQDSIEEDIAIDDVDLDSEFDLDDNEPLMVLDDPEDDIIDPEAKPASVRNRKQTPFARGAHAVDRLDSSGDEEVT